MVTRLPTRIHVAALDPGVADFVRANGRDPQYGYPATTDVADGRGPCRLCLRTFVVGRDRRILFNYNPFDGIEPYPQPGPVFIHAEPCEPYGATDSYPHEMRVMPMTLDAYAYGPSLLSVTRTDGEHVDGEITRLFADPAVDYLFVRNTEAGCFDARIERCAAC